ncbi:dihydroorotate dehydrogenase electron transfer subunit [Streptococcus sobrinus]|uniref:dihydroorotate dehydrogenase electron transfer subunit n=2 Tax=Streptococcus sobrinus TaxID=1310 RepID=UPI0002D34627|nr:dihydroorotate dehydrogenase electron transfer subunit [Streptococcus sobrinus]
MQAQEKPAILKENLKVISQTEIAPKIFKMILTGQMVQEMKEGQFLHLRMPDPSKLLRRPISICDIDRKNRQVTIIYRVQGTGTDLLSQMEPGDFIDTMGPQGNGFDLSVVNKGDKALLIGGGIGVPPLYATAKALAQKGVQVTAVLGFANKDAVILEEEMKQVARVTVTTDDRSYGIKGYVSTVVDELTDDFAAIYSCGAPGMLKYVDEKFADHPHAYMSLEERMACGMGACYACVVHLKDSSEAANKRVCEDGPVFETGSVLV